MTWVSTRSAASPVPRFDYPMLFDLRSRGRRRTVQVIYIGLAVLIASGLILFGVGTGGGGGGLFGALTGSSSSNPQDSAVNSQTKAAIKQTQTHPDSAAAWSSLVTARFSAANSIGYDSSTNTYTASGKKQLGLVTAAYTRYAKLTSKPDADTATLAARAYGQLAQYASAAATWQTVLQSEPGNLRGLECVTLMSYAAKNDRVAELAQAQVLAKVPKAQRKTVKTELLEAKTTPSTASEDC